MRSNRLNTVMVPEARKFFEDTDGKYGPQYRAFFNNNYDRVEVFNRNSLEVISEYILDEDWKKVETSSCKFDEGMCEGSIWNLKDMTLEKTVYK